MRLRDPTVTTFAIATGALIVLTSGEGLAGDAGRQDRSVLSTARPPPSAPQPEATPTSDDEELPPGHPALDDSNPHAHPGGGQGMPGVFQPPEDTENEDPTLAPGSIAVTLRDADDHPVPHETVMLGILINSIAKGDTRKHLQAESDDQGRALFTGLDTASNVAYRVSVGYQGGSFAATPFQLQQAKAMRVVLHVYPVARTIQEALIVCEATVAAEVRDDRIQIEQAFTVYNLGRTAWQPTDVHLALPDGYTAFNAQASMSDQGVDEAHGHARLHGTFPPGKHAVEFRWQLPWSGDKDIDFDVGLPPHVAIARVMMPAAGDIKLVASGFPPPEVRHDSQGQTFLVSERRLRPDDPHLDTLAVGIHDLPTPGGGRWVATFLATCGVLVGLVLASTRRGRSTDPEQSKGSREGILEELAGLERARAAGDVGPRTYERARRELMSALARTLRTATRS
jgi:hypothetical protein